MSTSNINNHEFDVDPDLFEQELVSVDHALPNKLHLIPIRYRPVFPGIVTPLIISQGRFTETINKVLSYSNAVGLVLIKDEDKEKNKISLKDLYKYGTVTKILKKINLPDGGINVLINSIKRFKIETAVEDKKFLVAKVKYLNDQAVEVKDVEVKALTKEILSQLKMISENNPLFTEEMKLTMLNVDEPGKIADFVTSILNVDKNEYQDILETLDIKKRLLKVLRLLNKEMEVLSVQKKIQTKIDDTVDKQQKEFFLREQLKAIKQELGIEEDERVIESNELRKKADKLKLKGEVKEKIEEEIDKIIFMDPASSEYTVAKNYIDLILSLPWNKKDKDSINLEKAEKILNSDHYGLEDVKERILEFLAVKKIKSDFKGSIICLVGPPGVGKTSLGKSIAKALNRNFFRISLGGMRDEAEIKGHRKTYIGSMPGRIIQSLKICKTNNPVLMLDEIDKIGQSYQGDPASALLEVLDPEQNSEFRDNFLDVPFDLSDVFFIITANSLDPVPGVLKDRMEVIRLSGYIDLDKYKIGKRYLLPKQLKKHGLKKDHLKMNKDNFLFIINGWAREAGVRNLERQIEKICRKTATLLAKNKKIPTSFLTKKQIQTYLGTELFSDQEIIKITKPGLAIGLAWTSLGGETLVIESIGIESEKNGLKLTGQLGEIMTESANIAYSYIKSFLNKNKKAIDFLNHNLIHVHVPAGATPKDGPSAGITIASSLYSIALQKKIKTNLAMTGELTLTGRVFPVGGIKEKIIAAKKANLKEIIIPQENQKDLKDIPAYIKKGLKFHMVETIEEVFKVILP